MTAIEEEYKLLHRFGRIIREQPGEKVMLNIKRSPIDNKPVLFIFSKPELGTTEDLNTYTQRVTGLLDQATTTDPESDRFCSITMNNPIQFTRVEELEQNYNLGISGIKIISSNNGIVYSHWPPDNDWLQSVQDHLSAELLEKEGIEDFQLIVGVIGIDAFGETQKLKDLLQNEQDVYLVDIGPYDISEEYKQYYENIKIRSKDIYYEYSTISSQ
jgi:hypothetical protein